jgi:hypothetical protein
MNASLIITGLSKEARAKEAKEIGLKLSTSFDMVEVETENERGIETVRQIKQSIARTPFSSENNVIIIHEAQRLTLEAQNALLKSLEEPPEKTLIILTAPSLEGLLPTVLSRCQIRRLGEEKLTLAKETEKTTGEVILKVLKGTYGERLSGETEINLDHWLIWWRERLVEKVSQGKCFPDFNLKELVKIVRSIEKVKRKLENNVNKKLAQDVLLLNLPLMEETK